MVKLLCILIILISTVLYQSDRTDIISKKLVIKLAGFFCIVRARLLLAGCFLRLISMKKINYFFPQGYLLQLPEHLCHGKLNLHHNCIIMYTQGY